MTKFVCASLMCLYSFLMYGPWGQGFFLFVLCGSLLYSKYLEEYKAHSRYSVNVRWMKIFRRFIWNQKKDTKNYRIFITVSEGYRMFRRSVIHIRRNHHLVFLRFPKLKTYSGSAYMSKQKKKKKKTKPKKATLHNRFQMSQAFALWIVPWMCCIYLDHIHFRSTGYKCLLI